MVPDAVDMFAALSNLGGLGIIIAFFVWKDMRADASRERIEAAHLAERVKLEEKRLAFDEKRLETDKAIAASLAALTGAIQSRGRQ